ncbi:MAG: TetR/AcrR family transcriptional regulator [Actinomycetes bacterium]
MAERDLAHDDRREQMLRAAIDVIAERGFPETRISDVGKRVGASSALVIYYFGTKDRLLTEALRYSEDLFYAEVGRRLEAVDGAWDKLESLVRLCCNETVEGLPGSWLLWPDLWAQAVRHPEVSRDREELDQRWRDRVADIVRDGVESGEFAPHDVDEFALIFTALLDGLLVQVSLGDPTVSAARAAEVTLRLAARELDHDWVPAAQPVKPVKRVRRVRPAADAARRQAGAR